MPSNEAVSSNLVRFGGEFELDFGACELRRSGLPLRLARIPMEVLLFLVEQRGQLVKREQIVERVWGKDVFLDTDNAINAVIRRIRLVLDDCADQPRFIQTVVGRGYRFIATIQKEEASPSFSSDLDAQPPESPFGSEVSDHLRDVAAHGHNRAKLWLGTAVGVLTILFVVLGFGFSGIERFRHASPVDSVKPFKSRPAVAVLGFKNLSGRDDEAWISIALQEMFSAELGAGQKLRVVPGEDVARMKLDLSLPASDSYGRETLSRIRGHLNTDLVLLGSYLATKGDAGGKVRIDLQLQDTRSGETIAVISLVGAASELNELVSQSTVSLRQKLGIA